MKLDGCERDSRADIVWLDRQRALQHGFFFRIAPEKSITERDLLERFNVARVEVTCALHILYGLFPAPLSPLDITHQLKDPGVIWQGLTGNLQLRQRAFVIERSMIEILPAREVSFTRVGPKTEGGLDGRFS